MYRLLAVAAVLAVLGVLGGMSPAAALPDCRLAGVTCERSCPGFKDQTMGDCPQRCRRILICEFRRSQASRLPKSALPADRLPKGGLPASRLPDSFLN